MALQMALLLQNPLRHINFIFILCFKICAYCVKIYNEEILSKSVYISYSIAQILGVLYDFNV